jgi:transposase-like protein
MDKKALEAFAREAAKSIKTPSDLDDFRKMLTKVTVETALNAELNEHLGYEKNSPTNDSNSRNGYSSKRLITDDGEIQLEVPRDRDASFEPKLVCSGSLKQYIKYFDDLLCHKVHTILMRINKSKWVN